MTELLLHPYVTYTLFSLFTLAIGSFLNVVIYRLPMMIKAEWNTQCRALLHLPSVKDASINLFLPRSHCPHCRHVVRAWQNIPILSFFLLKGRCAACQQAISWQYPLIEFICVSLSLGAAIHFGFNWNLLFALLFIWSIICLTKIDIDHQLLPDGLVFALLWLGLIANTQALFTDISTAVFSAAGAYLALWVFVKLFYLATGKTGMGQGDVKLFSALGAWFGWMYLPFILLVASISATIFAGFYLYFTKQSKETPIPFGPFLCVAGLIVLFYHHSILQWYLNGFY